MSRRIIPPLLALAVAQGLVLTALAAPRTDPATYFTANLMMSNAGAQTRIDAALYDFDRASLRDAPWLQIGGASWGFSRTLCDSISNRAVLAWPARVFTLAPLRCMSVRCSVFTQSAGEPSWGCNLTLIATHGCGVQIRVRMYPWTSAVPSDTLSKYNGQKIAVGSYPNGANPYGVNENGQTVQAKGKVG